MSNPGPLVSTPGGLAWAAWALTIGLAVALCRKRPEHRPFTIWAAAALAADVIRVTIEWQWPGIWNGPHTGIHRAVFHADQALFLLEPLGLVVVAWIAFLRRRPWPVLIASGLIIAGLVIGYPSPFRGELLGFIYAGVQGVSIIASLVFMAVWTRRRLPPRPEHAAVSLATLVTATLLAGPYAPPCPAPFETWSTAELVFLALWSAMALLHAASLWGGFGFEPVERRSTGVQ